MVQIYAVRNENFLTVQFQANSEHTDSIKSDSCLILIPNRAGKAVQGIASCSMFVRPDSFQYASSHQVFPILPHFARCYQSTYEASLGLCGRSGMVCGVRHACQ